MKGVKKIVSALLDHIKTIFKALFLFLLLNVSQIQQIYLERMDVGMLMGAFLQRRYNRLTGVRVQVCVECY